MNTQNFSWETVKQQDMVIYLETLGHFPAKINRHDYWYLSPFRNEKEASFKVDRAKNCWYDFGEGIGGNLVDFLLKLHNCTTKELYHRIHRQEIIIGSQAMPVNPLQDVPDLNNKIVVTEVLTITNPALINYLQSRRIPLQLARQYCQEVHYQLHERNYFAIGFKNNSGGYELRNAYFKGSSSPKTVSFLDNNSRSICVFEGFFNFLSYLTIVNTSTEPSSSFLILNSLSFAQKQKEFLDKFESIGLYLDNDASGIKASQSMIEWSAKCRDESHLYQGYKDLNNWHQHIGKAPHPSKGIIR